MRQGSENLARRAVCTTIQWRIIAALIVLTVWAFVDQTLFAYAGDTAGITANEIVERADRIRFPAEGFQVDVSITTTRPDHDPEVKEYRVLSKGNDRTLLMTTAPAIDKGNILLMRDHDLWAFLPSLSQPVRLPLGQRLTGVVANGDLARANFAGDYDATLLRIEEIDKESYYVLELNASRKGVTYRRVIYWVNKANYRPLKAEFYSLSNRLIKTCHYEGYKDIGGIARPTQLVMDDKLYREGRSVMDYSNMALRKLADKVFTKDYLKKLSK
jgi:outer membrane lipoprotein-sorting protein